MFCTWLFMRITEIKGLLKLVFCIVDQTLLCMVNSESQRRLYLHFLKFTNTQLTFYITYVLASLLFNFIQEKRKTIQQQRHLAIRKRHATDFVAIS